MPPQPLKRPCYVGRFAPSPTGELHQGSLLTAIVSFLEARHNQGKWLVRMEDIDPPRELPGAKDSILKSLDAHGLHWDDQVLYQSSRHDAYSDAIATLQAQQLTFLCACTRHKIQDTQGVYDGCCRHLRLAPDSLQPTATRVKVGAAKIRYHDAFQGNQYQDLNKSVGDFIIRRKDGLFAYQLAVAVDDIFQGITHIIRGSDLLESTPRQLFIVDQLKAQRPNYGHVPIMTNEQGHKLSKQTFATPLDNNKATENIIAILQRLKMDPPDGLQQQTSREILDWAIQNWHSDHIPKQLTFPIR
jgi:glutamyl-Q tRNA(Asp) synthetase